MKSTVENYKYFNCALIVQLVLCGSNILVPWCYVGFKVAVNVIRECYLNTQWETCF